MFYTNKNYQKFLQTYTFSQRQQESNKIMTKFTDRIPVICEKNPRDNTVPDIDKHKYLVPPTITVAEFISVIRKRIHLHANDTLFLFVGEFNTIPPSNMLMGNIYDQHKHLDGFLYIIYSKETTFG